MTKIIQASIVKRALVAIADLAFFLFVAFGIFAAGQSIANATPYGTQLRNDISSYQLDSGLYYLNEEGNAAPYDNLATYTEYETRLVHFYTGYLVSECPAEYRKNYDIYWYNVHILGLTDTKGIYGNDTILEPAKTYGPQYFEYAEAGVDVLAEPKANMHVDNDKSKPLTQAAKGLLLTFYYSPTMQNAYYNAGRNLYYSDFYQKALSSYQNLTNVIPITAGVAISGLIFYFVLPLVLKNGATLAKKMFGLCLLSAGGYKVKRTQVLLRQTPTILGATILFLFVPFRIAVMVASLVLLASYIAAIFTKNHQALHDFLGYTIVIDAKESYFYANEKEEKAAQESFDEAMAEADRIREVGKDILEKEAREKALKDIPNGEE